MLSAYLPPGTDYFIVVVFGLCVGSFLNVCIYRIPLGKSIVKPRSFCPKCGHQIFWYDNIPIVSYVLLRAKCRSCKSPISPRYPIVELLTAIMLLLVYMKYRATLAGLTYAALTAGLIVASFIDLDHLIIPNLITYPGIIVGLIIGISAPFWDSCQQVAAYGWKESLLGLIAGAGSLLIMERIFTPLFKKESLGMGDVKLLGMLGAFLGWEKTFLTLILSSGVGALVGMILLAIGKVKRGMHIPYGPFISLAGYVSLLWGDKMLDWYFALLFPEMR